MTRLYLDIDGVLTSRSDYCPVPIDPLEVADRDGEVYIVNWNVEEVRRLVDAFDEVVWATTWLMTDDLGAIEQALDRSFEGVALTVHNYSRRPGFSCGKLTAVRHHWLDDPAPFVWLDDHMGTNDREWASKANGHCFAPSYNRGGIYPHIEEVIKLS